MKEVSSSYIMALTDERAILKEAIAAGDDIAQLARDMLTSAKRVRAQGWSGDMADYMRGSVDFWTNQVKKYAN